MSDQEILDALEVIMDEEVSPALASHGGGGMITKVESGVDILGWVDRFVYCSRN